MRMMMQRVAAAGEPFRTFFDPAALAERLRAMGFHRLEDLGADEINARYFNNRTDELRVIGRLGRLMSAETLGRSRIEEDQRVNVARRLQRGIRISTALAVFRRTESVPRRMSLHRVLASGNISP